MVRARDDGSECDWGRVLEWQPPHRLVVTWQISGEWRYDPDPARASEIEVRFTADGPAQTTVDLEHRHLDRLVAGQVIADTVAAQGGGWSAVLELFAKAAVDANQLRAPAAIISISEEGSAWPYSNPGTNG